MWSRNGMPESSFAPPCPSRSMATRICVSRVSRWISALRMSSAHGLGECVEHSRVLVGCSDRESQAVGEEWIRAVERANQYTTLAKRLERLGSVGDASEDEVGRRGKALHPGDRVQRALEASTL